MKKLMTGNLFVFYDAQDSGCESEALEDSLLLVVRYPSKP